jgi:hypothetical protein
VPQRPPPPVLSRGRPGHGVRPGLAAPARAPRNTAACRIWSPSPEGRPWSAPSSSRREDRRARGVGHAHPTSSLFPARGSPGLEV